MICEVPRYLKVSTTLRLLVFRSVSVLDMGAFFATIIASVFFVFSVKLLFVIIIIIIIIIIISVISNTLNIARTFKINT